jgi:TPR repeat protein
MRLLLMLLVTLVCAAGTALAAGPLENGIAAYLKSDFATAQRLLRPLAEDGDARAQLVLGVMCETGLGMTQDYKAAATWYRKAADQGNARAQYNLGTLYERGDGVPRDEVQALKWYTLAETRFGPSQLETADAVKMATSSLAARMKPAQVEEARKLAKEWKS